MRHQIGRCPVHRQTAAEEAPAREICRRGRREAKRHDGLRWKRAVGRTDDNPRLNRCLVSQLYRPAAHSMKRRGDNLAPSSFSRDSGEDIDSNAAAAVASFPRLQQRPSHPQQYGPSSIYPTGRIAYSHHESPYPSTSYSGSFAYSNPSAGSLSPSIARNDAIGRDPSPSSSSFDNATTLDGPSRNQHHTSESHPSTTRAAGATKVSCLECRSSKVKCLPQNPEQQVGLGQPGIRCARCHRLDKACVFEKHKRGRKPDSWKYGRLEKQLESILSELRSDRDGTAAASKNAANTVSDGNDDDPSQQGRDSPGSMEEPTQKRLRTETAQILSDWRASSAASGGSKAERVAALSRALDQQRHDSDGDDPTAGPSSSSPSTSHHPVKRQDPLPETGLPSLSNPLKLLAQASAGDEEFGADAEMDRSVTDGNTSRPTTRNGLASKQTSPHIPNRRAFIAPPGRTIPPDRLGIYDEKLENGADLDPISQGLISIDNAHYLWSIFLDKLSHPLMLLDSNIYTFDYTRPRSSMLLSVGLALAARFIPSTPERPTAVIADDIDKHVLQKIIPTIIMEGKRSVHCAKALMLLAAYNGQSIPLSEDRSFTYVSWAFTMSVELDLNRRLSSMSADQNDETLQRTLRERERTFLEAWAYSFSIALHHGRRCNLSVHDPVVAAASQWHRSPFAIPEDAGLVSNIQLRQLIARNLDYFLQHVAPAMPKTAADGPPDQACRLLLEFHRRSITSDLDGWHATWVVPVVSEARPFRLHSTAYYHAYATLILHSLPMKHGTENEPVLKPFSDQAHQAALSVVAFFLRLPQEQIIWGHNSIHVTVGFAVVYALREAEPGVSIVEMVEQVIERMETAGNVTPHRRSFASGVARFLKKVLRVHCMRKNSSATTGANGGSDASRRPSTTNATTAAAAAASPLPAAAAGDATRLTGMTTYTPSVASSSASPDASAITAPAPLTDSSGGDGSLSNSVPHIHGNGNEAAAAAGAVTSNAPPYGFGPNLFGSVPHHPGSGIFPTPSTAYDTTTTTTNSSSTSSSSALHNHDAANLADLFVDLPPHTMPAADQMADQSPAAMMDTLMMNHPIGVQFNSLLGQNSEWGNDWSFFLPGGGGGADGSGGVGGVGD